MSALGRGFGASKVILLGEHAVVHGQPALAAALDVGVRVTATPGGGPRLAVSAWDVTAKPGDDGTDLERAMARLFECAGERAQGATIEVEVQVPGRAGMGSSAALSVAVIRALAELDGEALTADEVERRAGLAEEVFHGRASGIDAAVATRGGALWFRRGEPPTSIQFDPMSIVVAQVEPRVPTREMVAKVGAAHDANPGVVQPLFERIGGLVEGGRDALQRGELEALGEVMNENHLLLAELGVSTPGLDGACAAAMKAGALGAKLTGAGGGGCMIALAPGDEEAVTAALVERSIWVKAARLGGG